MQTRTLTVLACFWLVSFSAISGCAGSGSGVAAEREAAGPAARDWCLIAIRAEVVGEAGRRGSVALPRLGAWVDRSAAGEAGSGDAAAFGVVDRGPSRAAIDGPAAYFLIPMPHGDDPSVWTIGCSRLAGGVRVAGPVFGGTSRCEAMAGLRERTDLDASGVALEGGIGRVARVVGVYTGSVCERVIAARRLPATKMHHSYAFAFSPCEGGVVVIAGMNNFIGGELDTLQGAVFVDDAADLVARLEALPKTRLVPVRRGMEDEVGQIDWGLHGRGGLLAGLPPNDSDYLWIEPLLAVFGAD